MNMSPTLDLWQTEWCPASHRVRQRLTELGLTYTAHQVPVERDDRGQLQQVTGAQTIPVLVADGLVIVGEEAILAYLEEHFDEPLGAEQQRAKAVKAKQKELEEACRELAAATH
jgi:glutathione S-transferase